MAARTRIYHPGKPGTWPGGEPKSVRDLYDALLAEGKADSKDSKKGKEKR
ncbi:hypothetical protein [Nonomuraea maritima]